MAESTYVKLNLEESGTIYHLMMRAFMESGVDLTKPVTHPVLARQVRLMAKIGRANDYIMGKSAND